MVRVDHVAFMARCMLLGAAICAAGASNVEVDVSGGASAVVTTQPRVNATAIWLHGFHKDQDWQHERGMSARLQRHKVGSPDSTFGGWPDDYVESWIVQYDTSIPFAKARTAVEAAVVEVMQSPAWSSRPVVVHAHSMGGVLSARVFNSTGIAAMLLYDAPLGGLHDLAETVLEAARAPEGDGDDLDFMTSIVRSVAGKHLHHARLSDGQLAFIHPIRPLTGDRLLLQLRNRLSKLAAEGTHVRLYEWHPKTSKALAASGGGGGDMEGILGMLPKRMFKDTPHIEGVAARKWHTKNSARSVESVLDHMLGHIGSAMFDAVPERRKEVFKAMGELLGVVATGNSGAE